MRAPNETAALARPVRRSLARVVVLAALMGFAAPAAAQPAPTAPPPTAPPTAPAAPVAAPAPAPAPAPAGGAARRPAAPGAQPVAQPAPQPGAPPPAGWGTAPPAGAPPGWPGAQQRPPGAGGYPVDPRYGYPYGYPYYYPQAKPQPPPPKRRISNVPLMVGGILLTTAGVASLIAGSALIGTASDRFDVYCEDSTGRNYVCTQKDDTGRLAASVAMLIGGGVGLAVGIPMWVVGGKRVRVDEPKDEKRPDDATPPVTRAEIVVGPALTGVRGTF
jgi:hypothetical protein